VVPNTTQCATAPGTYREGDPGKEMEQSESFATTLDPLV